MTPPATPLSDDQRSLLLASADEAMAAATDLVAPADTPAGIADDVAWCRLVRRLWPRADALPGGPANEPRPGSRLGRFELRQELGRGGFGVVYRAHDPRLGRRLCASPRFLSSRPVLPVRNPSTHSFSQFYSMRRIGASPPPSSKKP